MPLRSPPGGPRCGGRADPGFRLEGAEASPSLVAIWSCFLSFAKHTFSPGDKLVERSGEGVPWRGQSPSQHLEPRGAPARSYSTPRQAYHFQTGHFLRILPFLEKYFCLKEPEACMSVMVPWRPHPRAMRESAVLLCGPSCGWHGPEERAADSHLCTKLSSRPRV